MTRRAYTRLTVAEKEALGGTPLENRRTTYYECAGTAQNENVKQPNTSIDGKNYKTEERIK
jgi:hypothetical protein